MRIKILLLSLMLGISITGCSRISVIVLNKDEIVVLKKGDQFTAPYDGTYYSQRAEQRVMNAKKIMENIK